MINNHLLTAREPAAASTAPFKAKLEEAARNVLVLIKESSHSDFMGDARKEPTAAKLDKQLGTFLATHYEVFALTPTVKIENKSQRLGAIAFAIAVDTQNSDPWFKQQENLDYFISALRASATRTKQTERHVCIAACLRSLLHLIINTPSLFATMHLQVKDLYLDIMRNQMDDVRDELDNPAHKKNFDEFVTTHETSFSRTDDISAAAACFDSLVPQETADAPEKEDLSLTILKIGYLFSVYAPFFTNIVTTAESDPTKQNFLAKVFTALLTLQNFIETKKLGKTALRGLLNYVISTALANHFSERTLASSSYVKNIYDALILVVRKNVLEIQRYEKNLVTLKCAIVASIAAIGVGIAIGFLSIGFPVWAAITASSASILLIALLAGKYGDSVRALISRQPEQNLIDEAKRSFAGLCNKISNALRSMAAAETTIAALQRNTLTFLTRTWYGADMSQEAIAKRLSDLLQAKPKPGPESALEQRLRSLEERISQLEATVSQLQVAPVSG